MTEAPRAEEVRLNHIALNLDTLTGDDIAKLPFKEQMILHVIASYTPDVEGKGGVGLMMDVLLGSFLTYCCARNVPADFVGKSMKKLAKDYRRALVQKKLREARPAGSA